MDFIRDYFYQLTKEVAEISLKDIKKVALVLFDAYKKDRQIFIFGNGGSATLASHFACDLGKGTLHRVYDQKEKRFRVISMADNVALLTAYANDLGYENIFSQQLKNLVNKGDVVVAITGSGNSPNVLRAIKTAKNRGAITIAFLGFDGGKLKKMVDYSLHVHSNHYGRIEGIHSVLTHLITAYLTEIKKNNDLKQNKKNTKYKKRKKK